MTKKENIKRKIGEAAMQCFSRYGLEKTTLDDIAKGVGLKKSSLYYYYKNKEDIFVELGIEEGEKYISLLQEKTIQKKGVDKQVWFYMHSRFEYYKNILNMNRVSPETLNKILPRFFELYDAMMKREKKFLAALIQKAIEAKEINNCDAKEVASVLINISDALKHSVEQKAILQGNMHVDYTKSIADMKQLISLIFIGLKCNLHD
ncbi:MAG: TetR/AcrR family transcriptional regulator [Bacteroidetes bacterium]|nr:TetR/AcrR family transcriptional regulator [Bacteroidota bacterium]